MKRFLAHLLCVLCACSLFLLAGCNGAPTITLSFSPSSQAVDNGQSVTITVTITDSANAGVKWTISGVGALSNQAATSVTYTANATGTATITATSVTDPSKSATVTVTVTAPPAITTTTLAAGVEGTAYNQTVAVTGGAGTLTYSITVGSLPAGLSLNSSTGAITGTPTGPNGTVNFTVQVRDSSTAGPQSVTKALSITINLPTAPSITTTSLPAGVEFAAYSQTLALTGGLSPFTWTITVGALPAGLALNASTGAITGTPTGPNGTASFTVKVADSSNPVQSATQALSITINLPPAPTITTTTMADGVEFVAYNQTITTSGGHAPLTFSISVGALPAGLSLAAATGVISGTPTGPNGLVSFTVRVTDSSNPVQSATQALSITIILPPAPVISTTSLPNGTEGSAYNQTIATTGGHAPLTFSISVGALPAGLSLAAATGVISGTPTGPNGIVSFTVKVTDSSNPVQSATQVLSITINLPPAPAITTASPLPNGSIGSLYSQTLAVSGGLGPFTWSLFSGTLPAGLSLTAATGVISGTPTGPNAISTFTVQVTDSSNPTQSAQKLLSITIAAAPLSITTTSPLPNGVVGQAYTGVTILSAGGAPPVTWSISAGTLPAGLTLVASTGAITGTPTVPAGLNTFTVMATDSSVPTAQTATKVLSIQVIAALSITTTTLPAGTVNTPYSQTVLATGGTTPITWSITVGTLPAGLTLAPSTGVISGTPTGPAGTASFTVKATDSTTPTAQTATQALSITINVATLVITTTTLPNGAVGTAYNQTLLATGGTPPVTWSITVGALPAGLTLAPSTGVISGTPTGSAGTTSFTVRATDSTTPTAQTQIQALSITVTSSSASCPLTLGGAESLLTGTYAMQFNGWNDTKGMFQATASVIANGTGTITGGVADSNGVGQTPSINQTITSGCYTIATGGRGKMIWNFSGGGSVTFSIVMRADGKNGNLIEFDDTTGTTGTRGSGNIRLQDSTLFLASTLSSSWGFGVRGAKGDGARAGTLGVFTLGGASGTLTSGAVDYSELGISFTGLAATGTFTAPDATHGRGTLTIVTTAVPVIGTLTQHFAYYITRGAAGTQPLVYLQSTDAPDTAGHPLLNGLMLKQIGGPFSNASLTGTVIFALTGDDTSHGITNTIVGVATSPGDGTFSGFGDQESDAAALVNVAIGGTVSIGANGLGTLHITSPVAQVPTSVVMVGLNSALMLEGTAASPGNDTQTGLLQPQTGSSFSTSSLSGTFIFGSDEPAILATDVTVGTVVVTSPGSITITEDDSTTGGLQPNQVMTGTYTMAANGRGVITITSGGTGTAVIWLLDSNSAVIMPRGGGNITLLNVQK